MHIIIYVHIIKNTSEVLDMEELGMEAVWKIRVEDFPAFIVVDDKGNDFFEKSQRALALTSTFQESNSHYSSQQVQLEQL